MNSKNLKKRIENNDNGKIIQEDPLLRKNFKRINKARDLIMQTTRLKFHTRNELFFKINSETKTKIDNYSLKSQSNRNRISNSNFFISSQIQNLNQRNFPIPFPKIPLIKNNQLEDKDKYNNNYESKMINCKPNEFSPYKSENFYGSAQNDFGLHTFDNILTSQRLVKRKENTLSSSSLKKITSSISPLIFRNRSKEDLQNAKFNSNNQLNPISEEKIDVYKLENEINSQPISHLDNKIIKDAHINSIIKLIGLNVF